MRLQQPTREDSSNLRFYEHLLDRQPQLLYVNAIQLQIVPHPQICFPAVFLYSVRLDLVRPEAVTAGRHDLERWRAGIYRLLAKHTDADLVLSGLGICGNHDVVIPLCLSGTVLVLVLGGACEAEEWDQRE